MTASEKAAAAFCIAVCLCLLLAAWTNNRNRDGH